MELQTIGTPALWVGFTLIILVMLILDLGVFHRRAHQVRTREALIWTAVWVSLALSFSLVIWSCSGTDRALEFLTGYLIEKALSVDNLFIFFVIFSSFSVPEGLQHRILFWGILGALVMRAIFIGIGAVLLQKFHWAIYPFGALLVWTGIKLLIQPQSGIDPKENRLVRLFRRWVPSAKPFLVVLVTIEVTDIIFALDSIPAIFAVTSDPFIVYTSNIFAMLGLRALYFALVGVLGKLRYLRPGLALILAFVGTKMLLSGVIQISILFSLGVVVIILGGVILASIVRKPNNFRQQK